MPAGRAADADGGLPRRDPDSIAVILHTSGTTASPKRVPRPHRTYVAGARASRDCTNLTPTDVGILGATLHTNQGVGNLLAALFCGGCCVVAPGFDPIAFPDWLAEHRPTWFVSTPTEITLLLDAAAAAGRESVAGPGSQPARSALGSPAVATGDPRARRAQLGRANLRRVRHDRGQLHHRRRAGSPGSREGSCGRRISTEIRVLDEGDRELPPGATGAIVIRGPTLFPGYLDEPEVTAALFLPRWLVPHRRPRVCWMWTAISICNGRAHELINRGGSEDRAGGSRHTLLRHPAVADAAVFAVPDARLGEDIVAALCSRPGASASQRELRRWMLDRLSRYKVPRRIWVVEALPRTRTGKVQRGELTRRWSETRG